MAKPNNQWQELAREAAERIDRDHAQGEQLALLPDEMPEPADDGAEARGAGRPKGAKNKVSTQMRDYLVARGCRLPEDVLVEIAGLNTRHDVVALAMRQTERLLGWAFDGAYVHAQSAPKATAAMRLDVFRQQYTMILRAAEALMPYMAAKASPDVAVNQTTNVIMPAQPTRPADQASGARDITPQDRQIPHRMVPADVLEEMQKKQEVTNSDPENSDAEIRTDEASD